MPGCHLAFSKNKSSSQRNESLIYPTVPISGNLEFPLIGCPFTNSAKNTDLIIMTSRKGSFRIKKFSILFDFCCLLCFVFLATNVFCVIFSLYFYILPCYLICTHFFLYFYNNAILLKHKKSQPRQCMYSRNYGIYNINCVFNTKRF